jgi:uncharacterized protein (TIGR00369 family)
MTQLAARPATRTLTFAWDDPASHAQQMRAMNGIDYVRGIQAGEITPVPFARLLGLSIPRAEPGEVAFSFTSSELWHNPMGTLHGGIIGTLLDTAMGMAVQSTLPAGTGFTTMEYKVNFIRPVFPSSGELLAEGKVLHSGRTQAVVEARLVDASGKLFAVASSTCAILGPDAAGGGK